MNAQFKPIIEEAGSLAERLRAALAGIAASEEALKSIQNSQRTLQAELDTLVASGAFENDENAVKVSNLNARLQLIPGRIKQIEGEVASAGEALRPLLNEGYQLGNRFENACSREAADQATAFLETVIAPSQRHSLERLISEIARETALVCDSRIVSSVNPVLWTHAKSLSSYARSAVQMLEQFPVIITKHIPVESKR